MNRDQGKLLIGESLNVIQHPDGRPKQVALQQNELIDRVDDFLHYRTDTAPGSSGAPLFNNQWEIVGLHHSGVPERNANNQIVSVDGTPWQPFMGEATIKWIANEGIRISSIMAKAASLALDTEQTRLLDEFLNAPSAPNGTGSSPRSSATPPAVEPERSPEIDSGLATVPPETSAEERLMPPPALDAAIADAGVKLTIPLHLTIQLGTPAGGGLTVSAPLLERRAPCRRR